MGIFHIIRLYGNTTQGVITAQGLDDGQTAALKLEDIALFVE